MASVRAVSGEVIPLNVRNSVSDGTARLPLDILWLILAELSRGDSRARIALQTCRLLNRNICAIATPMVFRALKLHAGLENSTTQMNGILEDGLELLEHVRSLEIPWTSAVPSYHIHGLSFIKSRRDPKDFAVNWTMVILERNSTELQRQVKIFAAAIFNLFNACKEHLEDVSVDAAIPNVDNKVRNCASMLENLSMLLIQPFRSASSDLSLPSLKTIRLSTNSVRNSPRLRPSEPAQSIMRFDNTANHVETVEISFRKEMTEADSDRSSMRRSHARPDHLERLRKQILHHFPNLKELTIKADYQIRDLAMVIAPTPKHRLRKLSIGELRLDKASHMTNMINNVSLHLEELEVWDTTITDVSLLDESMSSGRGAWWKVFETCKQLCQKLVKVRFDGLGGLPNFRAAEISSGTLCCLSEVEYESFDSLRVTVATRRKEKGLAKDTWLEDARKCYFIEDNVDVEGYELDVGYN